MRNVDCRRSRASSRGGFPEVPSPAEGRILRSPEPRRRADCSGSPERGRGTPRLGGGGLHRPRRPGLRVSVFPSPLTVANCPLPTCPLPTPAAHPQASLFENRILPPGRRLGLGLRSVQISVDQCLKGSGFPLLVPILRKRGRKTPDTIQRPGALWTRRNRRFFGRFRGFPDGSGCRAHCPVPVAHCLRQNRGQRLTRSAESR